MQIVLKKIWLGEIGKIYRDLNENLRKNLNLRIKVKTLSKMANC